MRDALRILNTIALSIVNYERSFSKLILTYMRTYIGQDGLGDLAFLGIDRATVEQINFDQVFDQLTAIIAQ